jgi:hypothetical protein
VKIQVSDTIPPVLTVAAQKDVQAGQPWTFDSPTATDNCGGQVVVSVVSTTTNYPSPGVTAIVRVWQAQDACGNLAIAQQTVLVHAPTTPPVITTQPRGEAAAYGGVLTLTAAVSGTGPFTYQWLLNGVAIAGATNSTYQVNQALYGNAGVYTVVVSNAAGSVTSVAALVNVVPRLEYQRTTNGMVLTWPAPYILQSANTPRGVFQDVRRATSPYLVNTSLPQQYFRLRNQSFALSLQKVSGGYQITGAGMPGCNFILQASTNLVSWSNLATNTGAINFTDTSAANYPQRFYRAVLATP